MAARVAVLADADVAPLCGLADSPQDAELTVVLGTARSPDAALWVRWLEEPPLPSEPPSAAARVLAPGGEGLWRRAPWPAADALFQLELASRPTVAVAIEDEVRRAALVDRLASEGAEAIACERLTIEALSRATAVVVASAAEDLFPARAFAALAARRVLILDELPVSFGLLAGRDHVAARNEDELFEAALSVARHPDAFHWMRTLGALAAERQRASRVYARLATDLDLEGRDR
jgi:hypothetical protein